MNPTFIRYKKYIPYIYLIILTIVSEIYLFTSATPYEAINQLRFYCYILLIIAIVAWNMLQTYKPFLVNMVVTCLALCLIVIQNYMFPQLTYEEAESLVIEQYQVTLEKTNATVFSTETGTDLYLFIGYIDGDKSFFSVNPITEEIEGLGNLDSSSY